MNYYEFVSRGTSWDVMDLPASIEVDETETEELLREYEKWTMTLRNSLSAQSSRPSPES